MAGAIRIVDTSVLCNILHVPNMDQERGRAERELRDALQQKDVLLLPVAVIYETGNHIAQNGERTSSAERGSCVRRAGAEGVQW